MTRVRATARSMITWWQAFCHLRFATLAVLRPTDARAEGDRDRRCSSPNFLRMDLAALALACWPCWAAHRIMPRLLLALLAGADTCGPPCSSKGIPNLLLNEDEC